jgi:uncharacterized membrane protein
MRLPSIDIVRGAVMVLMALDHVRVYAGVPAGGPEPGVFFTRWVTHFCAPVFVFLAGTSAYLYGRSRRVSESQSLREARAGWNLCDSETLRLSTFLAVRGLWLVLLELTVLRFAWTFNFDYAHFTFAGVIWVIGWSMVVLAGLVFLPAAVIAAVGVIVIAGHNTLAIGEQPSPLVQVLYAGWSFPVGPLNVVVLYTLIPWVGVMAAGYAFGAVATRRRVSFALGIACIALFIVLRATGIYGDPRPWESGALQFLNTAKYPASLQFLLMTLAPMFLALALLENARARWLEIFGKVPFFYYLLHIPLIHAIAVLISLVRTPESTWWLFANHPMLPPGVPPGYRWSLGLLYLVTALVVLVLYFPCRWYARAKAGRPRPWMRFV